jgi:hypothetical protein
VFEVDTGPAGADVAGLLGGEERHFTDPRLVVDGTGQFELRVTPVGLGYRVGLRPRIAPCPATVGRRVPVRGAASTDTATGRSRAFVRSVDPVERRSGEPPVCGGSIVSWTA